MGIFAVTRQNYVFCCEMLKQIKKKGTKTLVEH